MTNDVDTRRPAVPPSRFRPFAGAAVLLLVGCFPRPFDPGANPGTYYYPDPSAWDWDWEWISPVEAGFDGEALHAAVEFAIEHESDFGPDIEASLTERIENEPNNTILGPLEDRGPQGGVVLRHGYKVAEWGDPGRVDMSFSVTKSLLSTTVGLAWDRGMIEDLRDPVLGVVSDSTLFASEQNAPITWEMLLQQTSEWEGTLWGKPDTADRREGRERSLQAPGTFWEYNDVRVNLLARAITEVWEFPLPEVLDQLVMEPIGATASWEWHGYPEAEIDIDDGPRVAVVSGGGHWGGGLWISTDDLARFGYLLLRQGRWEGRDLLSREWIRLATAPSEPNPSYGYMWWLNPGGVRYPSAPETSIFAIGGGSNVLWIDPEHDLVVVLRWIDGAAVDEFIRRLLEALVDE